MWFVATTAILPSLAAAGALLLVTTFGCDLERPLLCGQIPEAGCPIGRGGTCEDATCLALYDCVDGDWIEVESCDVASGGAGAGGEGGVNTSAGGCDIATFDHAREAEGCEPDLQPPDCPVEAAEVCEPCATGCVDFYLCLEGDEAPLWTTVAYCDDDGALVVER